MDYTSSGVNVALADKLVDNLKSQSDQIGKYAAEFTLPIGTSTRLVSSCDGVGTKVLLALEAKKRFGRSLSSIGEDCVAMVINDLLCENANPLFFMDYFATSSLNESDYNEVLAGIIAACGSIGVKLIGGETAELPGMFQEGALDVCGFGVGTKDFLDWYPVKEGDVVIGIHSTGVHSNGFSLVRKILENNPVDDEFMSKLLVPTPLYKKELDILRSNYYFIKAAAHITGGGWSNIDRVLETKYDIAWEVTDTILHQHEIFSWLQTKGNLTGEQMRDTFNCGIGMVVILENRNVDKLPLYNYTRLGTVKTK